jgi:hypothetical protein
MNIPVGRTDSIIQVLHDSVIIECRYLKTKMHIQSFENFLFS